MFSQSDQVTRYGTKIVGMIALTVGGTGLFFAVWRPFQFAKESRNWNAVACEVISSEMKDNSSSDGPPSYSPLIRYTYEIEGKKYESQRVWFSFLGGSEEKLAPIIKQFPAGSACSAFVSPADPSESVLIRNYSFSWLSMIVFFAFFGLGLILIASDERSSG